MPCVRGRRRLAFLLCLLVLMQAAALPAARGAEQPDLLLEVRLGKHLLSEAVGAYQHGGEVLLPLGEMARLLTIAIRCDAPAGRASGYILDEHKGFELDLARREVAWDGRRETLDPGRLKLQPDDIYVPLSLLVRWLPAGLEVDLANLTLQVTPRARLPVQARLERAAQQFPGAAGSSGSGRAYPLQATPYALAALPFIDQTIGFDLDHDKGRASTVSAYTAYLTADLAGTEAALYLNTGKQVRGPVARLALARHDPDGGLLGPLHARTLDIGHVAAPGVAGVAFSSTGGNGLAISNRPLGQPSRFDRHNLQGDLAPGWEVELYFNEALSGYQQARADGKYSFNDQPLVYGMNDFRLVFHGPLGQLRVERHSFLLEQSLLAPGEIQYILALQRDGKERRRSLAQFDVGLGPQLSAGGGLTALVLEGQERQYANLGLHAYWQGMIVDAGAVRMQGGGTLGQFGIKSRLGPLAVSAAHTQLDKFSSEQFRPSADPIAARDEVRLDAMLAQLPLALQARRDRLASGQSNTEVAARLSAYRYGTSISNTLRWKWLGANRQAEGVLQASRRMAGIGFSAQVHYDIAPRQSISALSLSADRFFDGGYQLNAGLTRSFLDPQLRMAVALNKSLGSFGMGIHANVTNRGSYGAGIVLFVALGREPRGGRWISDAAPMAGSGAVSARVFLDKNLNGVMDADDEAIPNAGFTINGSNHPARTDGAGLAWLGKLAPDQYVDIGFDSATVEDPQWQPRRKGVRLLPRPGKVNALEFAVIVTGEIDGTAYLSDAGVRRGAGDIELELVDEQGAVAASATSGADGYYIVTAVAPGRYQLRVAPAQLARLKLRADTAHAITIGRDGNVVSGKDFVLAP